MRSPSDEGRSNQAAETLPAELLGGNVLPASGKILPPISGDGSADLQLTNPSVAANNLLSQAMMAPANAASKVDSGRDHKLTVSHTTAAIVSDSNSQPISVYSQDDVPSPAKIQLPEFALLSESAGDRPALATGTELGGSSLPEGVDDTSTLEPSISLSALSSRTANNPRPGSMAPTSFTLDVPVNHAQWGNRVADRIVWMSTEGLQAARLSLNPPDLGAVDVRLSVVDDQVSVWFQSGNAAAREALEATLPRLREMFQEQGLQLGQAHVSDGEPFSQHADQNAKDGYPNGSSWFGDRVSEESEAASGLLVHERDGLIDTYA
ncbi:MAG: flagellar hook-length control protein FliK [Pseudomonadota bacterium]|nr:flagellar hook-length control protein FliK [Pseudomonadota bacterium]